MSVHVNIDSAHKNLNSGAVNISGIWKILQSIYVNIGGTWKITWVSGPTLLYYIDHTQTYGHNRVWASYDDAHVWYVYSRGHALRYGSSGNINSNAYYYGYGCVQSNGNLLIDGETTSDTPSYHFREWTTTWNGETGNYNIAWSKSTSWNNNIHWAQTNGYYYFSTEEYFYKYYKNNEYSTWGIYSYNHPSTQGLRDGAYLYYFSGKNLIRLYGSTGAAANTWNNVLASGANSWTINVDGRLFVRDSGYLREISTTTGAVIWSVDISSVVTSGGSVLASANSIIILHNTRRFSKYDINGGGRLWTYICPYSNDSNGPNSWALTDNDKLYYVESFYHGYIVKLDVS